MHARTVDTSSSFFCLDHREAMSPMHFVTEPWQPIQAFRIRLDEPLVDAMNSRPTETYEMRHWLALIGVALLVVAPFAGALSGTWASVLLLASIAILLVSTASLLVPDERADTDAHESGENRRWT